MSCNTPNSPFILPDYAGPLIWFQCRVVCNAPQGEITLRKNHAAGLIVVRKRTIGHLQCNCSLISRVLESITQFNDFRVSFALASLGSEIGLDTLDT